MQALRIEAATVASVDGAILDETARQFADGAQIFQRLAGGLVHGVLDETVDPAHGRPAAQLGRNEPDGRGLALAFGDQVGQVQERRDAAVAIDDLAQVLHELVELAELAVTPGQRRDDILQIVRILELGAAVSLDGRLGPARVVRELRLNETRADALRVGIQRPAQAVATFLVPAGGEVLAGLLAMKLRDHRIEALAGRGTQAARRVNGVVPVLFLLVDDQQLLQGRVGMRAHLDEFLEQPFRAIQQARSHVVHAELEQRHGPVIAAERRPRDEVLVNPDGAVDFAASPEQVSEGEVRLDGLAVEFQHLDEHFDCLVRLLVQHEVEATEVVRVHQGSAGGGSACAAPRGPPAGNGGHRQQQGDEHEPAGVHHGPSFMGTTLKFLSSCSLMRSRRQSRALSRRLRMISGSDARMPSSAPMESARNIQRENGSPTAPT